MKRAFTATTRTQPLLGLTSVNDVAPLVVSRSGPRDIRLGTARQLVATRKRPPRIVFVVACSQRKRVPPSANLRLASISARPKKRAAQWAERLDQVDATRHRAEELYAGDHWYAVREAFRLARRYSSRAELWVISAGYGLIRSSKSIKAYSATFGSGTADSVWRGPGEGERRECLQQWWRTLGHESTLPDLLLGRGDNALVIAAGAAYLVAVATELEAALQVDGDGDRFSIISAGARGNAALLPVSGRFRKIAGGTDSALNARLLALLASEPAAHRFRHSAMAATLNRIAGDAPIALRRRGTPLTDKGVATRIREIRRDLPGISRTEGLRKLRSDGIACEQARFASIWESV
jgi:hypothetical protein